MTMVKARVASRGHGMTHMRWWIVIMTSSAPRLTTSTAPTSAWRFPIGGIQNFASIAVSVVLSAFVGVVLTLTHGSFVIPVVGRRRLRDLGCRPPTFSSSVQSSRPLSEPKKSLPRGSLIDGRSAERLPPGGQAGARRCRRPSGPQPADVARQ